MKPPNTKAIAPPNISFQVVQSQAYYDQLLKVLPGAKKRIVLAAMGVLWGEKTDKVFHELEKALSRGVHVHVLLDAYTRFAFTKPGQSRSTRLRYKKTVLLLEELQQKGARISMVGKLGFNPFKGRCHVKITVVDDHCFSFGGVNFTDESFVNSDYMLYAKHSELADCLEQLVTRVAGPVRPLPNAEVPIAKHQSILFDGGEPGHSIVYDQALQLATKAKKVWYVSQMAPNNRLVRALQQTDTTFFFNRPEAMEVPANWSQAFDQQRFRITNSYSRAEYLHAKFILFELQDGTKALISGSHNLTYRGVAFGTQEIALHSTDTKLWNQLKNFIDQHISVQ